MRTWTRAFAESAKTKKMMTQAHVTPIGAQPAQHSISVSRTGDYSGLTLDQMSGAVAASWQVMKTPIIGLAS